MGKKQYWLFKSEPSSYSFLDLLEDRVAEWDGVRNYQARNFMRLDMRIGDEILFYHSEQGNQAIFGTARVVQEGYPDFTAWDSTSKHFDPKSNPDNPIWFMVDIEVVQTFLRPVTLKEIKDVPQLQNMGLLRRGNRLSIQPLTENEYNVVVALGNATTID